METTLQDRIRGSLIGGAIGDALGYPVEFMSRKEILARYGSDGITKYDLPSNGKAVVENGKVVVKDGKVVMGKGKAVVSDDTQMTLFTTNGLLYGIAKLRHEGESCAGLKDFVRYAYLEWYETQTRVEDYRAEHCCWIRDIAELNVRRAPGNTCMSALRSIKYDQEVQNDSKGCGGVMRVAPVGLMAAADAQMRVKYGNGEAVPRRMWDNKEIVRLGGDCAELTHKHPLGYLPAALLADLIYYIMMHDGEIRFDVMEQFLHDAGADCRNEYKKPNEQKAMDELMALIDKAIRLANDSRVADEYAIPQLGKGWTGDEALAIAVYCSMRHLRCFEDAVIAAVNHDGDSDSTGSICGNIMGAITGLNGIPDHFIRQLELKELITDLADDLLRGCPPAKIIYSEKEEIWQKRYIEPVSLRCFNGASDENEGYTILPKAKRVLEVRQLEKIMYSNSTEKYPLFYQMALDLFDTDTFDPFHPLTYHPRCDEPRNYSDIKEYTPAYYYGYYDRTYSPDNSCRVFKLNVLCFEEEHPIIAFRFDGLFVENDLRAGLREYDDESLVRKYPGWTFYLIDRTTADGEHAVFTNNLEKEFAVEIAHLWEDGTLHCIYYLHY